MAASDGASSISVAIRVRPFTVGTVQNGRVRLADLMGAGTRGGAIDPCT